MAMGIVAALPIDWDVLGRALCQEELHMRGGDREEDLLLF